MSGMDLHAMRPVGCRGKLQGTSQQSIRQKISFSNRRFDAEEKLSEREDQDLLRVYRKLEEKFGEEYALAFVFTVRTATELHRAWNMTLLTSNLLKQIKSKYQMRMSWNLSVIKIQFRAEDGKYVIHRRVPYDYDSEYQDLYTKIAVALIEGRINIHQALLFQEDTKKGLNTAKSGLFLRDYPGRLVLYPLEAATCAVIFFKGDLFDGMVAAICGLAAGLVEYLLVTLDGNAKNLIDVLVGVSTGVIGSLFYRYTDNEVCLPSIFLGTLYWFFYGTAFVIGILEIVGGELETGVIRFMAVSVKTFVLSLGASFGMALVLEDPLNSWHNPEYCGQLDIDGVWWRIPLYLLCSASALGQYRFPVMYYWRGLIVQLVGYVIQYEIVRHFGGASNTGNLDTACANVWAAIGSVLAATILSTIVDRLGYYYNAKLLQREYNFSLFGRFMYKLSAVCIRFSNCIGVGRKSDVKFLNMKKKLKRAAKELEDPNDPRTTIKLEEKEERVLVQAIISAESLHVWSVLMPTVYQLVPGSLIAKLWFNKIFPVPPLPNGLPNLAEDAVLADLMVTAASLALGLLLGWGINSVISTIMDGFIDCTAGTSDSVRATNRRKQGRNGIIQEFTEEDPSLRDVEEFKSIIDQVPFGAMESIVEMAEAETEFAEMVKAEKEDDAMPSQGFKSVGEA